MRIATLSLTLLLAAGPLEAETRYITDQFEVTLRTGESTQHSIIRMLGSGAAVNLLETNPDSGYSRIQAADGQEGWVITRFLMDAPAARNQLAAARDRLAQAEQQRQEFNQRLTALNEQKSSVEEQNRLLREQAEQLQQEITRIKRTAGKALEIDEERQKLKQYLRTLETDLQKIRAENESLKDRSARDWFMVGGGVLLLGVITGVLAGRMRGRRRSGWEGL